VARSRGLSRGHPSTRRKVGWEQGVGQVAVQTQVNSSVALIATAALAVLDDGITLVRTRGSAMFQLESATSGLDGFAGAIGIGVATSAAVTAGAASVPTPITEQAWDGWLYWNRLDLRAASVMGSAAASDIDILNSVTAVQRFDIDSKAMRKLRVDDSIYCAIEVTEVGTAVMSWRIDSRMLFKLP